MNLSHSRVDSWYSREPFLSDVGSSFTKPIDSHVVFRNKTYPTATAALEAYIDEYLGHSNRGRCRYGRDCVADLLLMKPVGDTSSLPSVSVMSSSESEDRGSNGCSGIKMPDSFARDNASSDSKKKHPHCAGTSLYESTRDLDRILAESKHSVEGKKERSWDTAHMTMDQSNSPPAFTCSSTHKPMSPAKTATFTHVDLQKIRSRVCENASYRSFLEQSRVHRRSLLSRSLDSLLSNHNDSDSTMQDSDDKYSSDGGRCPPSWIQDVDGEEEVDGTIVSGHMIHRRITPRDKAVNVAVSTPKHLALGQSRNYSSLGILQVEPPSGGVRGGTSNSASMRLRHGCLQSTDSPDTFDRRDAGYDSRLDLTIENGSVRDTYFDSESLSWSRMGDLSHMKTPTLREKPTDLSRSLNDVQASPERRTPRPKRDGSPGKTVCFDFTPQEPSRKLPPVYDLMAPWQKDSQREAYLRRLENEIEDSPSSVAGDSLCSSSNWKACDTLGTSLGICGDSAGVGTGPGEHVPSAQLQVEAFSCSAQPEVGTFLEKIRHLLATPPPYEPRGTASGPGTPTSEQILDGDRSWEKTSSKATPDYLRELSDLTGTMDVDKIVAALLTSTGSTSQTGGMSQCDSLRPGTKEALKNILFAMQSTMATVPLTTATTPVIPASSQKQASMAVQTEQRSLEHVKNLSDSITPESRQLLAARATQEAGGESLERALVHLARLKELVENTKESLH